MGAPPPPPIDRVGHRFLRGSVALTAGSWFSSFINLGLNLMLARLLGPSVFGLHAFVSAINGFISIVAAFGIALAVLQAREESDERDDTAYALSAGLGAIALLCALAVAPFLAAYHSSDAAWFIVAFAVFRSLEMQTQVHRVRVERQLRYGVLAVIVVAVGNVPGWRRPSTSCPPSWSHAIASAERCGGRRSPAS